MTCAIKNVSCNYCDVDNSETAKNNVPLKMSAVLMIATFIKLCRLNVEEF